MRIDIATGIRSTSSGALALWLALIMGGCARGVAATSPGAPPPVDAPPGDAERICAAHPIAPGTSTFFVSASIEDANSVDVPSSGDLWPSCSSGGLLYTAWGDGFGFAPHRDGKRPDIGIASVSGAPWDAARMRGTNLATDNGRAQSLFRVWTKGPYYQKPTGILCLDGKLYLAVQDLNGSTYDDAPAATIAVSDDDGAHWTEGASPMFSGAVFTTIMFLDAGKDRRNATDSYVYAYGLDHNWRASHHVLSPRGLYLARIAADRPLLDRDNWELYSGADTAGNPTWSRSFVEKKAVLTDCTERHSMSVVSQGGVVYDAPLKRYIYTSWTEYTFELYEAPAPWGPWRHFLSKDFGLPPWTARSHGGYGTSIPSEYISEDGRTMWVQSNTWSSGVDHNNFALRRLVVAP